MDSKHTMTINKRLEVAGCKLDSHESDLYVKDSPEARHIISTHFEFRLEQFRSQLDKQIWLCLPFCNDLWWQNRKQKVRT